MDNKFWMHVVRLSEAYHESGLTPDERCTFIVRQFENLPPVAQREVLAALRTVSYGLSDLHSIVNAKALQLEQERKKTGETLRSRLETRRVPLAQNGARQQTSAPIVPRAN